MPVCIVEEVPPLQETVTLTEGDVLLIYSDGIPEAGNLLEQEFGESRLLGVIDKGLRLGASQLCGAILDSVKDFSHGCHQADDLTVVAAKFTAEGR